MWKFRSHTWIKHLNSKTRLYNEPDQSTKLCEICNLEVAHENWYYHLRSKTHRENDPDQTVKPLGNTKLCEKCNVKVRNCAWDAHLKSKKHLSGEPDESRKVCEICNIEVGIKTGLTI